MSWCSPHTTKCIPSIAEARRLRNFLLVAGKMAIALVCTLLFLFQHVKVSISPSPGDLYINGVVYTGDDEITLYNGGSLSIQATNSQCMCILLMTMLHDDWTNAEPKCAYTTGALQELYCEVGDKYTYSTLNFMYATATKETNLLTVLKNIFITFCNRSRPWTHIHSCIANR